jgi:branched-chain amino acid transport system substrate-binding protein
MTVTRRTFGIAASGLLLGPIAAPYIRKANAAGSAIRVGVVNSMSGGLAAYAQEGQPAFEYIIKKINGEGGIKSKGGAKIELVQADDTSQPARTATEARRLITEEKVQLLTGTILSAQMLALTPVLDELKVPTLSIWAGGSHSNYMFTLGYPYDRGYAQTMHDFVIFLRDANNFSIKTAVMGYSNYEAGQQVNQFLTQKLKVSGVDHRRSAARYPGTGPDLGNDPYTLFKTRRRCGAGDAARWHSAASGSLQSQLPWKHLLRRDRRLFRPVAVEGFGP